MNVRGWVGLLLLGLWWTVEVHRVHALQPSDVVLALPVIDGLRAPQGTLDGHRTWRAKGFPLVVVSNSTVLPASQAADGQRAAEIWTGYSGGNSAGQPETELFVALSPFLAAAAAGASPVQPKWLFFSHPGVEVNLEGLRRQLRGWDHKLPYVVTDCVVRANHSTHASGLATDGQQPQQTTVEAEQLQRHYTQQTCDLAAPRCLPCHVDVKGQAPLLAGCPCNPAVACHAAQHASSRLSGAPDPQANVSMSDLISCTKYAGSRYYISPAGGVALSWGLLQRYPFTDPQQLLAALRLLHGGRAQLSAQQASTRALSPGVHAHSPADRIYVSAFRLLSRLLWDLGYGATAPVDLEPSSQRPWSHSAFGRLPFGNNAADPDAWGTMAASSSADAVGLSAVVAAGSCARSTCAADLARTVSSPIPVTDLELGLKAPLPYAYEVLLKGLAKADEQMKYVDTKPPAAASMDIAASASGSPSGSPRFYEMDACLSHSPGPVCPAPGACLNGTCLMPKSGRFNWDAEGLEVIYDYMVFLVKPHWDKADLEPHWLYGPPGRAMCLHTDTPGSWWAGQWVRDNSSTRAVGVVETPLSRHPGITMPQYESGEDCEWHRVPRRKLIDALAGKRAFFIGDSLNRQMYHRLIWYIRGIDAVIEHYYHDKALYTYYKNGTDLLDIGAGAYAPFENHDLPADVLFFIGYSFSVGGDRARFISTGGLAALRPDVFVSGGVHYDKDDPASNITGSGLDNLVHNVSSNATYLGGKPMHVFWVMLGAHLNRPGREDPEWLRAAIEARHYVARLQGDAAKANINLQLVPYDILADASPFKRNEMELHWEAPRGLHYQCSVMPFFPATPTGYKMPDDRNCKDEFDLNLLFLISNSFIRWQELHP